MSVYSIQFPSIIGMRQQKHFLNNFELLRVNLNQNWEKLAGKIENWGSKWKLEEIDKWEKWKLGNIHLGNKRKLREKIIIGKIEE